MIGELNEDRLQLTNEQAISAAPLLTEGMLFIGEFRGKAERLQAYEVKDQKTGKVIEKVEKTVPQFLVEIQPSRGISVSHLCEMYVPKGEEPPQVNIRRGVPVLVVVRSMEFSKFLQKIIIKIDAIYDLTDRASKDFQLRKPEAASVESPAPAPASAANKPGK